VPKFSIQLFGAILKARKDHQNVDLKLNDEGALKEPLAWPSIISIYSKEKAWCNGTPYKII
jgi:hypothetical protein